VAVAEGDIAKVWMRRNQEVNCCSITHRKVKGGEDRHCGLRPVHHMIASLYVSLIGDDCMSNLDGGDLVREV
jgi:hypothetical protein